MELSTTTGKDYVPTEQNCSHCSLDTAGAHQETCPLCELQRLARAKAKVLEWETLTVLPDITWWVRAVWTRGGLPWWMP